MDDIEAQAQHHSLVMTLSLLLAMAAKSLPDGTLDRMHQSLVDLVTEGTANSRAVRPDMPREVSEQLVVATCVSLDTIFGTAKAIG